MDDDPTWNYTFPDNGQAYPTDLAEGVWDYIHNGHNFGFNTIPNEKLEILFSKSQLISLLNVAFQTSLKKEEGRSLSFQLRLRMVKPEIAGYSTTLPFASPLDLTVGELVKLAPAVGLGFRSIMIEPENAEHPDAKLQITGIHDFQLSRYSPVSAQPWFFEYRGHTPSDDLLITVFGPGSLRVTTPRNECSFDLYDGTIHVPLSLDDALPVKSWYIDVGIGLSDGDAYEVHIDIMKRTWVRLLKEVCNRRHGGCFLVVPSEFEYEQNPTLIQAKYTLNTNVLFDALKERAALEPELYRHVGGEADTPIETLDAAHFRQRDIARVSHMLAGFSAVDGAVLLRRDLKIIGFGSRIGQISSEDVAGTQEEIEFKQNPYLYSDERDIRRVASFGMRHQSAFRFCQKVENSLAFVASQDGELRVFCNVKGEVTAYEPFPSYRSGFPID